MTSVGHSLAGVCLAVFSLGLASCRTGGAGDGGTTTRDQQPGDAGRPEGTDREPDAVEDTAFTVFAAGDVYLGSLVRGKVAEHGDEYPFSKLRATIQSHSIAFANLEAPISVRGKPLLATKKPLFRISPEQARPLESSGLEVVSLANNHTMDFGQEALVDTLETLDAMSIAHTGAGRDGSEASAPAIITTGGTRVVFLAYNGIIKPGMRARDSAAGMNPLDIGRIVEDIREHDEEGTVVLVSVHWGLQYEEHPHARQVRLAHSMIDAGAEAVLGHHPHCPQSIEVYEGKPVFYSLGNFIFGMYDPVREHNIAAVLAFEGDVLVSARILPVHGRYRENGFRPYFLSGDEAREAIEHIGEISHRFGTQIVFAGGSGIIGI